MIDKLVFNILLSLIVAFAGIIAGSVLPFLRAKKAEALASLKETKFSWAADIIEAVVRAVEQTVSEEMHGDDKKNLAIKYIQELLGQNGIEISAAQLDVLIESAVQVMNEGRLLVEE